MKKLLTIMLCALLVASAGVKHIIAETAAPTDLVFSETDDGEWIAIYNNDRLDYLQAISEWDVKEKGSTDYIISTSYVCKASDPKNEGYYSQWGVYFDVEDGEGGLGQGALGLHIKMPGGFENKEYTITLHATGYSDLTTNITLQHQNQGQGQQQAGDPSVTNVTINNNGDIVVQGSNLINPNFGYGVNIYYRINTFNNIWFWNSETEQLNVTGTNDEVIFPNALVQNPTNKMFDIYKNTKYWIEVIGNDNSVLWSNVQTWGNDSNRVTFPVGKELQTATASDIFSSINKTGDGKYNFSVDESTVGYIGDMFVDGNFLNYDEQGTGAAYTLAPNNGTYDVYVPVKQDCSSYELTININGYGPITAQLNAHNLVKHDAVPATCLNAGTKEYYECSKCGAKFADSNGTTTIADADLVVNALGHTWVYDVTKTCVRDAQKHCSVCNETEKEIATGHNFVNGECTVCHEAEPELVDTDGMYQKAEEVLNEVVAENKDGIKTDGNVEIDFDKADIDINCESLDLNTEEGKKDANRIQEKVASITNDVNSSEVNMFDLSILVADGTNAANITDLGVSDDKGFEFKIQLSFTPEAGFEIRLFRIHNGIMEEIKNATVDANGVMTFRASKFSTYAVTKSKPIPATPTPKYTPPTTGVN